MLSGVSSVLRVQISRSSAQYSAGKSEELSRSLRRFCPSPDQFVEACKFLHGEAEVLSKSRSFQSSPVKSSLGFWPSPLRSTSYFSPRTLTGIKQDGKQARREASTTGSKHDGKTRNWAKTLISSISTGAEKYSGLITGQKFAGRVKNRVNRPRSSRWLDLWDQDVACILTCGRSDGVLHVSWTCSLTCGARGAAAHASGAMRSDTRPATNLKLIGWCLL
ncbi:hypothetical protein F2Q69_00044785 [Brassica cretica]|uniref:Uncharacterized protein n=1 Tax=Brassica cretica TaxID=69181 RepID=A0A8S9NR32_BRACR|nr:hypothetical protein F2Q69_00044785 [Brassica cretica]